MRVSTRGEYGVRAMFDLALNYGSGPIPLKTVARRQLVSETYLEQLMGALRKAGLVASKRGAQGGYELAHPRIRSPSGRSSGYWRGRLLPWTAWIPMRVQVPTATSPSSAYCGVCGSNCRTAWNGFWIVRLWKTCGKTPLD